jgi:hypothetical protein
MTADQVPLIVVDGANVVGSRPDGWWRDRPGAARRLLAGLIRLSAAGSAVAEGERSGRADLVLVLEGGARAAAEAGVVDGVRIVHAQGSGDDEIVAVVAAAGTADATRPIMVITADRGLRERVESHGATTVGPQWLWDRLDAAQPGEDKRNGSDRA